jgi:hypothetical protein
MAVLGAFEAFEAGLDQVLARLGEHLHQHVIGDAAATRPRDEIEIGRARAGKPTSISLQPTLTSRSKKRIFFSAPIGSISAWLPSRRSVESQRGGLGDGAARATGGRAG